MRLGRVSYTNCLPVFHALETKKVDCQAELVAEPPATLNKLFGEEELEATAVSSIAYARLAEKAVILPDLSIASDGRVQSVLLLSKRTIRELDGKEIFVTSESETSVALLTILLREHFQISAGLIPASGSPEAMLVSAPAALAIGDQALKALYRSQGLYVYDLGEEWQRFSGEKMVFAVWSAQRKSVVSQPREMFGLWQSLQYSKAYGLSHPWEIAARGSMITGLPVSAMLTYYRHLKYHLDQELLQGLECFFDHAFRLGLLEKPVKPEVWSDFREIARNSR